MRTTKIKSFTLPEMLVVMIITAIVVGLAFSVLSLVQKQVHTIQKNFDKTTRLSLLEQRLWQDFNQHNNIAYQSGKLIITSDTDTVQYSFFADFAMRNTDTIHSKLKLLNAFYTGYTVQSGPIDAVSISAENELPGYLLFISSSPDATYKMNQDGF